MASAAYGDCGAACEASSRQPAAEQTDGDSAGLATEGCRQRGPHFRGETGAAERPLETASSGDLRYEGFMFPHKLDRGCLEEEEKDDDSSDEDTDPPESQWGLSFPQSLMNADCVLPKDPVEREKWVNRGWRAAQCCGGTLLVLALIFDEMD
ncbi:unnamed protein product [Prorocentrum cordatum]|uniref:Uncharacterized protein n=1 Tax=Prorocentrum cordatum TaxID=2364126 RepID=A0ABN9PCN5_9DINO|nr:unnamed protein product [Polarella glacialis]